MARITDWVVFSRFVRPDSKRNVACEPEEGMTHQEFKDECDINRIMARALKTGNFPVGLPVGRYGDFSEVQDFQSAQELLKRAQGQFDGLPSRVREKFKNDPGAFLAWIHDKKNLDEAADLGLLNDEAVKRVASERASKGTGSGEGAVKDK